MNLFSEQNSWIPALAALVVLATLILSSPRWLGWFLAKGRALRERFTPRATVARVNDVSHEIRKARNLALGLLVITGLIGLRHLNTVPYRLKVYDENNRLETAADLFGSYYRPIKEGEDVGQGVRYHSLKDAEEAYERNDLPSVIAKRARVEARAQATGQRYKEGRLTIMDVKRWLLQSNGVDDDLYSDAQIEALSDAQFRTLTGAAVPVSGDSFDRAFAALVKADPIVPGPPRRDPQFAGPTPLPLYNGR
jgi:hypothetical protein